VEVFFAVEAAAGDFGHLAEAGFVHGGLAGEECRFTSEQMPFPSSELRFSAAKSRGQ